MLEDFQADGNGELSVTEGQVVTKLMQDDGAEGWSLVALGDAIGFVPEDFIATVEEAAATRAAGPALLRSAAS